MGLEWGWNGVEIWVGMGLEWGWNGVGMGLECGWNGVGMGLECGWNLTFSISSSISFLATRSCSSIAPTSRAAQA